jgi:hypothetical protein
MRALRVIASHKAAPLNPDCLAAGRIQGRTLEHLGRAPTGASTFPCVPGLVETHQGSPRGTHWNALSY